MFACLRNACEQSAACRIGRCIEALRVLFGPAFAVAPHLRPYDVGEFLVNGLVVEPELLQRLIAEAGYQHVGRFEHLVHEGFAVFVFQIDRQPLLVHRCQVECRVVDVCLLHAETRCVGAVFVSGEGLNLVYRGSHLSQDPWTCRSRDIAAELYNFDSFKPFHVVLLLSQIAVSFFCRYA